MRLEGTDGEHAFLHDLGGEGPPLLLTHGIAPVPKDDTEVVSGSDEEIHEMLVEMGYEIPDQDRANTSSVCPPPAVKLPPPPK